MTMSNVKISQCLVLHPLRWHCVECVIHHEWDVRKEHPYMWHEQAIIEWSWHVISIVLAATLWSFAQMPLGLSDRNKMVLWSGCEGRAKCSLHKKNVRSVRFVVKRRGCCCNLSVGIALNVWFSTNGMCTKNNTHIYVARTSNKRVILSGDLYYCLLPMWSFLHLQLRLHNHSFR